MSEHLSLVSVGWRIWKGIQEQCPSLPGTVNQVEFLVDYRQMLPFRWGSPGGSVVKNMPAETLRDIWDGGSIPGLREGNGNPLQCSCLENPLDRGAWQATLHGVTKSWTWLSNFTSLHFILKQIHHISFINSSVCLINSWRHIKYFLKNQ